MFFQDFTATKVPSLGYTLDFSLANINGESQFRTVTFPVLAVVGELATQGMRKVCDKLDSRISKSATENIQDWVYTPTLDSSRLVTATQSLTPTVQSSLMFFIYDTFLTYPCHRSKKTPYGRLKCHAI